MATKHHHVLVFATDASSDTSLACSRLGISTIFRRDYKAVVTAVCSKDPRAILPLIGLPFECKEAKSSARLTVLSQSMSRRPGSRISVFSEHLMNSRLMASIDHVVRLPSETVGAMTLIFACHGDTGGAVHFGRAHVLYPGELLGTIEVEITSTVSVSLNLLQCCSGKWILESQQLLTRQNVLIHAACSPAEQLVPLRSASNKFRCSLFGVEVVETPIST
jgi:hypothetical protein